MNIFKNWNAKDVEAFNKKRGGKPNRQARGSGAGDPGGLSSAVAEPVVRDVAHGAASGEAQNPGRVLVRITSYRLQLTDPDNFCPKYFIDCCRYAGFLRDDTAAEIELDPQQIKVGSEAEEKTVIEILQPRMNTD